MKKSRRTYNGVHLNKKSNTQDVVEQSLTKIHNPLKNIANPTLRRANDTTDVLGSYTSLENTCS